ncbi:MAG: hypothetical protein KDD53_04950 [Bdellovibrionales bacterium]|nr:hypothetical protein [Bdellovibrionales bacterium]
MIKYWLILILSVLFGTYCLYAFSYFAWVTATPVSPAALERAQMLARYWGITFLVTVVAVVAVCIRLVQLFRAKRSLDMKQDAS